jgi:hypothetical protein
MDKLPSKSIVQKWSSETKNAYSIVGLNRILDTRCRELNQELHKTILNGIQPAIRIA